MKRPVVAKAAQAKLKINPPLGLRPSLENTRLVDLKVDASYQRSIDSETSKTLIRRIASCWDWSLYHPLTVSRRLDGTLWVVDGQHRLAAARLRRDMHDLPCVVTPYESRAAEAASFVAMNAQRRALSALDLFRAALASGDSHATLVHDMLCAAGLQLAKHTNYTAWKPGEISFTRSISSVMRQYGYSAAVDALNVTAKAFSGQVLRYGGTIFAGLGGFLGAKSHPGVSIDLALLTDLLRKTSQHEWVGIINRRRAQDRISGLAAGARVFADVYKAAFNKRFSISGDQLKKLARTVFPADPLPDVANKQDKPQPAPPPPATPAAPPKAGSLPLSEAKGAPSAPPPSRPPAPPVKAPEGKPNTVRQQRPVMPIRLTPRLASPAKKPLPSPGAKEWCDQCDRRRFSLEIERCGDKHCPFDKGTSK